MKRDLPFPMPRAAQTTGGAMALRVPLAIALAWIIGWYAPTAALMVHTWAAQLRLLEEALAPATLSAAAAA